MIVLNLFIGVILSGMDEAQQDADDAMAIGRKTGLRPLPTELAVLNEQLQALQTQLDRVARISAKDRRAHEVMVPGASIPDTAEAAE